MIRLPARSRDLVLAYASEGSSIIVFSSRSGSKQLLSLAPVINCHDSSSGGLRLEYATTPAMGKIGECKKNILESVIGNRVQHVA